MSLRTKILSFFVVLIGIAFIGQGIVMQFVVFPQFVHLEEQSGRRDMERIQQGIVDEVKNLDILCHDWASWDDSVKFIEGNKDGFVATNIPPEFFEAASIDYLHFIDQHGRTKYYRAIDLVTGGTFSVDGLGVDIVHGSGLAFQDVDPAVIDTGSLVRSGLVFVDAIPEPLLLTIRPILSSANTGPVWGTLIMGRFLRVDALQQKVGVNVSFIPVNELGVGVEAEVFAALETGEPPPLLRYEDDSIWFYRLQESLYGGSLCLIAGNKPAEIIQHGRTANRIAMLCYLVVSVLLLVFVFILVSRIVSQPIRFLSVKTNDIIKSGNFTSEIDVHGAGEIADLGRSINGLLQRIIGHEELLFAANNKLLEQSLTDSLTGLSNRRNFDEYMEKEWVRLQRSELPLSIIMGDVDYFKKYNDAYGHQQGDVCLQTLATALTNVVKRPTDLVSRYGGEEFVVVLPETDAEGALHVAGKICREVRGLKMEHAVSAVCPWVTISVGVATIIPHGQANSDYVVRMADEALYLAKEQGRNRVEVAKI